MEKLKTRVQGQIKVSLRTFVAESTKEKLEKATAMYGGSLGDIVDYLVDHNINENGVRRC